MAETRRFRTLSETAATAGSLTTIATGGALIGLGLRQGEASRVFRLAGRGLIERVGAINLDVPLTSVALGYLHHLVIAAVWGAVLGVLAKLPRGATARVGLSLVASFAYGVLSLSLLPPLFRIGYAVTSDVAGVVPITVAMLLALVGDVWLDASETQEHSGVYVE